MPRRPSAAGRLRPWPRRPMVPCLVEYAGRRPGRGAGSSVDHSQSDHDRQVGAGAADRLADDLRPVGGGLRRLRARRRQRRRRRLPGAQLQPALHARRLSRSARRQGAARLDLHLAGRARGGAAVGGDPRGQPRPVHRRRRGAVVDARPADGDAPAGHQQAQHRGPDRARRRRPRRPRARRSTSTTLRMVLVYLVGVLTLASAAVYLVDWVRHMGMGESAAGSPDGQSDERRPR